MAQHDHYLFMDGCVVKGCHPTIDFEHSFGEYAGLLEELFERGNWGHSIRRLLGRNVSRRIAFNEWAEEHVHLAQSTQNKRTGAARVHAVVQSIAGQANIHFFGTSAAGAAMLEYFLLTDPQTLYYRSSDPNNILRPARRYPLDPRIASLTMIDAPMNWVPLRRDRGLIHRNWGKQALGQYLPAHTRIVSGPHYPVAAHTVRCEDVPGTWVGADPVADLDFDNHPHYDGLPEEPGIERHIYTGGHMSHETRAFLERVWR
jgi:hypothetical protein